MYQVPNDADMQKGSAYISAVLSSETTLNWAGNVGIFLSGVETEIFFTRGKSLSLMGKIKVQQNGRYTVFSQDQQRLMKSDLKGSQIQSDSTPFLFTQMVSTFSSVLNCPLFYVWKKCGSMYHGLLDVSGTAAWNESPIVFVGFLFLFFFSVWILNARKIGKDFRKTNWHLA